MRRRRAESSSRNASSSCQLGRFCLQKDIAVGSGCAVNLEVGLERELNRRSVDADDEDNWWDFCPICNTKMVNQKCKYICPNPKCHFFMSCSEFDR
jgi:hypothetical protein